MKKIFLTIAILIFSLKSFTQEEKTSKETKTTFAIMPIHNSGAGFNNVFLGSFELKPRTNLTFYSVFWVNPSFGNQGKDLFLETGVGLGFASKNGKLYVNPSIGFGHGKLLSNTAGTKIAESFIPGFKVNKHFSFGGFYEHLGQTRVDTGDTKTLYQFLGGYVKATLNNGVWFRFAAGPNISNDNLNANEFYKIQAFIPL